MKNFITNINSQQYFLVAKKIFNIAIPLFVATAISVIMDLICLRIIGVFNKAGYYIIALFMPFNYLLIAIYESYRASATAIAATLHARYKDNVLGDHLFMFNVFSLITLFLGLIVILFCFDIFVYLQSVANVYRQMFLKFIIFMMGAAVIRSWLNNVLGMMYGIEKQKLAMYIILIIATIITICTYFLSYFLGNAMFSYAYSIAFSSVLGLIFVFPILYKSNYFENFSLQHIRNKIILTATILYRVGMPIFISYAIIFSSLFMYTVFLSNFGPNVVSGFGVGYQIQSFIILPAISLGVATGVIINKLLASNLNSQASKVLREAVVIALIVYFFVALLVFLYRDVLVHMIVQNGALEISEWASKYLYYTAPTYIASGPLLMFIIVLEQTGLGLKGLLLNMFYFSLCLIIGSILLAITSEATVLFKTIAFLNIIFVLLVLFRCFVCNTCLFHARRAFS